MEDHDIDQVSEDALEQAIRSPLLTPIIEGATLDDNDIVDFLSSRLESANHNKHQPSASR